MKFRRAFSLVLVVVILFICSGCSLNFFSVESLMSPPLQSGKNGEVEAAFKKLMSGKTIQLRTPASGDYQTAFVLFDMNGDGIEEAIVFYTDSSVDASIRMAFMECVNDTWMISADVKGAGSGVNDVSFSDLNENGEYEILVGWSLYDSKTTKIVSIYEISLGEKGIYTLKTLANEYYNAKAITDFNGDDKDDLIVIYLDDSREVQKSMFRCFSLTEQDEFIKYGEIKLDSSIEAVSKIQFDVIDNSNTNYKRTFVDCLKTDTTMFTEVVYWDEKEATLLRTNKKPSESTLRSSKILCSDIDGDGKLEVPSYTTLYGDEKLLTVKKADTQYTFTMIKWLNVTGDKSEGNIRTLFNPIESYLYRITRYNDVTVYYDILSQALKFCLWDEENELVTDELFSIAFRADGDDSTVKGKKLFTSESGIFYYDITEYGKDFGITEEGVKSSFIIIN